MGENERERLEDVAEVKEKEAISRFREKVETHLAAKDIILNILEDATKAKKPTRPTTRMEEPANKLPRMGMKDGRADTPGGPGHHHGGGAPHQQINTRACGNSSLQKVIEASIPAEDLSSHADLNNSIQREQEELLQPDDKNETSNPEEDSVNSTGGPGHHHGGGRPMNK
jgi:hypothetical protein